jgi:hypothetical protein
VNLALLTVVTPKGIVIGRERRHFIRDTIEGLRVRIRAKIADGRLPRNSTLRVWGGRGGGDVCTACDHPITKEEFVLGGLYIVDDSGPLQFHVVCFWIWHTEVRPPPESDAPPRPRLYVVRPPRDCANCGKRIDPGESGSTRQGMSYHADCALPALHSQLPKGRPMIEFEAIRLLIRTKMADGRLPTNGPVRVWGGRGDGESCDICEETITKDEFMMESIPTESAPELLQLHVKCFWLWHLERHRVWLD